MKTVRPFQRLRRLLGYGVAVLLVLAAVLLSSVRLVLPYAADYRADVEAWVSGYVGQPVRIERLDARLLMISPTLILDGVELMDPGGARPLARFASIHIGIAPLASLRAGNLVMSELTVVGARLAIERREDGSLQVEGLSLPDAPEQTDDPLMVGRWLLAQHRLNLRESSLVWRDQVTHRERAFEQVSLELRNNGKRHRLDAALHLSEDLGSTLRVAADLRGDLLHLPSVEGDMYAAVERGRPAGVMALLPIKGLPGAGGEVTAKVWGRWEGRLRSMQGEFHVQNLLITGPDGPFTLDEIGGRVAWSHEDSANTFDLADLVVVRAGRRWQPTRLQLRYATAAAAGLGPMQLQANFLRLEDLSAAAGLFPLTPEQRGRLHELHAAGDLRDVHVAWNGTDWTFGAAFQDLALAPGGARPGVEGLDGYAWYANGEAGGRLTTRNARLQLPKLFRDPLTLSRAQAQARIHRNGPAWRLVVRDLDVANDDIAAHADLVMTLPDQGSPYLDLVASYRDGRATSVYRYLPAHIMSAGTVRWLDRAFKEGRVREGTVAVHGALSDFPFDHAQGRFEVRFDAEGVALDYMPKWPWLRDIDGEVVFDGRRMRIEARSAHMMDSAVGSTVVSIPDLLHPRLQVRGQVEGPFANLLDYLRASGLAGRFGETLARFQAGGSSVLALDFEQPLGKQDGPGRLSGSVQFQNARLQVAEGVEFTNVRGSLGFEGDAYKADSIEGQLFGEPVSVVVQPHEQETAVIFAGTALGETLAARFPSPLTAKLSGRAGWSGRLAVARGAQGESRLTIESPLEGLRADLPEPLGKTAEQRQDLQITAFLSGARTGQAEATLAGRAGAAWERRSDGELTRAALHFGNGLARLPDTPSVRITGSLPVFAPAAWLGLLPQNPAGGGPADGVGGAPLPVHVDMDELGLVTEGASSAGGNKSAREETWPSLKMRIARFSLGTRLLGSLEFQTVSSPGQITLRDFGLRGRLLEVTGAGEWRKGPAPRTELELVASSPDFGELARSFDFASAIAKGRLHAELKLAWPGGPESYELARLDGTLRAKIKEGVLEEVDPGAGRLLGLLSLEALPRRLMLDFRDLYEKGVRFRRIEGTFRIERGDAYTNNLHMDTIPAGVFVSGRTGFVQRDYDHTITVVPEVSGTLPVAGGLALGPQVGAVLLLVQSIFKDEIDDAARFRYTVTGPWEKPVVKAIKAR